MIGWTSVIVALQQWLSETSAQKAASSSPAYLSVGMALLSVGVVSTTCHFKCDTRLTQMQVISPTVHATAGQHQRCWYRYRGTRCRTSIDFGLIGLCCITILLIFPRNTQIENVTYWNTQPSIKMSTVMISVCGEK